MPVQPAASALGEEPALKVARPPYGSPWFDTSNTRKARVGAIYREFGYACIMWNIDSRDWAHRGKPAEVVSDTRRWLDPSRGGVALYHDIHQQTVDALPDVIDLIRSQGFGIVPLSVLLDSKRAIA